MGNNRACYEPGKIYTGVVSGCEHGDQLYHVSLDGGDTIHNCLWAAGMFSGLFGFKTTFYPPLGTRVSVLAGQPSFIISTLPSARRDPSGGEERIMTSTGKGRGGFNGNSNTRAGRFHTPPSDMLEGEFEIGNEIGVAIQFLTNLISLKGSERAKVEVHLLNDMVRIVSDTFKHFNAFGDHQIYNDGGLNVRWDGTSRDWEALGIANSKSKKTNIEGKKVKFDDDLYWSGRWRYSQFVGFLGDFVHTFVTDPQTAMSNIGASATNRAAKSRLWMGSDGTLLAQSVTEIALERVCRIVTPNENKRWDDPEGLKKSAWKKMVESSKQFTKVWDYGKGYKDIYQASFQLREYARWLSNYHSYARFHQYENATDGDPEWKVGGESDVQHEWTGKEPEVESVNKHLGTPSFDTYACIRIMRDGSIISWDGYGSACSMTRGLVQVSSTRHLEFSAAGDIRMTAGNDIYLKARRHIEITAVVGGIVTKARTMWKALCEWGTIWLKSDAVDPDKETPPTPDDPDNDPKPEVHSAAILLDASKGRTIINGNRKILMQCYGAPDSDTATDDSASVVIQSKQQDVRSVGQRHAVLKSQSNVATVDGVKGVVLFGPKLNSNAYVFDVSGKFTVKGGTVNAISVRAKSVAGTNKVAGPTPVAWVKKGGSPGYHEHGNHVSIPTDKDTPEFASSGDVEPLTLYKDVKLKYKTGFTKDNEEGPTWKFGIDDYDWTYNDSYNLTNGSSEIRIQPLAQQRIVFDSTLSAFYDTWTFATADKLKSGPRTEQDYPYPGLNAKQLTHDSEAEELHKPSAKNHSEFDPSIKTNLTASSIVFKFLKK